MNDRSAYEHLDHPGREIALAPGLPAIPERLLLAHARGEVLFLCGAGVSRPAGLPDFRQLALEVYRTLDPGVWEILTSVSNNSSRPPMPDCSALTHRQVAEVKRFLDLEYDVVLGMLERRLDSHACDDSKVRGRVVEILRSPCGGLNPATSRSNGIAADSGEIDVPPASRPAPIHSALIRLADRGTATTIMTTNYDLLFEAAARKMRVPVQSHALGSIPRPTRRPHFAGVLHIHGALASKRSRHSDLILTDQDFGEFYLRRRVVPDLIHDAARLFNLVLVGYRADDPPMRYLLDAIAAEEGRFDDLKERFVFVSSDDTNAVAIEDWRARGVVPIRYDDAAGDHSALLRMLQRWADCSAINGKRRLVDREIRRIVNSGKTEAPDFDRELFDHLFRRASRDERVHFARVASEAGAEPAWLDSILTVSAERERRGRT